MGRHRSTLRELGWGVSNSPNPWKQGSAKRVVRTLDYSQAELDDLTALVSQQITLGLPSGTSIDVMVTVTGQSSVAGNALFGYDIGTVVGFDDILGTDQLEGGDDLQIRAFLTEPPVSGTPTAPVEGRCMR